MIKNFKFLTQALMSAVVAISIGTPMAARGDEPQENPYVSIYKFRSLAADAELGKAKANLKNAEARLKILQDLNREGAIGDLTVKDQETLVETTKLSISELQAKANEAKAMFQIAQIRIAAGLEMPVCPEP